ncbi:MAG TPA: M1 family aminopeptidase [Candidatus Sulfotelmatobacter sp.]|nr:M1 family aminopeptidase [Candidatus Sulfotelmatobacter sp.]
MTKVLIKMRGFGIKVAAIWLAGTLPLAYATDENPPEKPAEALYLQLGRVGLDPTRVYKVRGASLDRSGVSITLEDGTIGFTQDVMGRITGAFFEGDGEVLLTPPNNVERRSMSLFTGMAILEEHFATAYFRFNDDTASELQSGLRATDEKQEFADRWGPTTQNLAQGDAMRLLVSFSRMLPGKGAETSPESFNLLGRSPDRFFHARIQGTKLGVFDVLVDSLAAEQVEAGQARPSENGITYYDVWTSFSLNERGTGRTSVGGTSAPGNPTPREDWISAQRYSIKTEVRPPKEIHARARVQLDVREGGTRTLVFELSRFLNVESVKLDGQAAEFIHNPAVEGTQLSRRGNDILTVILPEPARAGQKIDLEFLYGGEVLAEAGSGLLYVGARGTWFPNRGMAMADFDLEFDYPPGWTLVATGKPAPVQAAASAKTNGEQVARFVSERPIPVAGFNLGKYKVATTQAGSVTVETYAASGVERDFPSAKIEVIDPGPSSPIARRPQVIVPNRPSPARNEVTVGDSAARAIQYYAERFGPYPYSRLALTQMPGRDSQGWPGLVFLSSYAFLDDEQREQLHFGPDLILMQQILPAHETAHQWWGDLISWSSYRDQWLSEGLANYCALMMLQEKNPSGFRQVMEMYRQDLVVTNKDGVSPSETGPVTLGMRLWSSRFPEGYEAISYGRGTWLFHMLRTMLKDAAAQTASGKGQSGGTADEPFVRALRKVRQRYEGKSISTRELIDVFAEDLPPALRYEGKNSLDWFMDGWVNGTSLPKLELKGVKFTPKGAGSVVSGTILQKNAPENLVTSVPVYAVTTGKQSVLLGRVFADGEESSFHLPAPAGTHRIVLDPNETILTSPK